MSEIVTASVRSQDYAVEARGSFDDLPPHGKLVYMAFMKTAEDAAALAEELFKEGRRTAEETLLQEAQAIGCPVLSVHLTSGALLSWIRDRSDWAGQQICDTYNQDLINAILRIIAEIPTANRWVIAYHIQQWEAARQSWKEGQVAVTEAFIISHEARMRFWEMNKLSEPQAWFGYSLICELCQEIAAHNPYTLSEAERIGLPHVGCLDQWHIREGETVDCSELWLGQ